MYPQQELDRLAAHKVALRLKIARRRDSIARAARGATRPLAWVDRLLHWWRQAPPLLRIAFVPLAGALGRVLLPRHRTLGRLLRWSPAVLSGLRHFIRPSDRTA